MHPNQFFSHVTMLDESFIPGGAQALLASAIQKISCRSRCGFRYTGLKSGSKQEKESARRRKNTQYCRLLTIIRNASTSGSACSWKTIRMRTKGI